MRIAAAFLLATAMVAPLPPVHGETEPEIGSWLRLDEVARMYVLDLELVGERIRATSSNPATRHAALRLQAGLATAMLAATSHPDVEVSTLDAWVLIEQTRRNLGSVESGRRFGRHAGDLELLVSALQPPLETSLGSGEDAEALRRRLEEWVGAHPLDGDTFRRPSAVAILAERLYNRREGPIAAARRLGRASEALESRLGLYAEVLPRVARWQAQLAAETPAVVELLTRSTRVLGTLESALEQRAAEEQQILADLDARLAAQRQAALAEAERIAREVASEAVARAADEVVRGAGQRLAEQIWKRALMLAVAAFFGALLLVVLHARLTRRP